MAEIIEATEVYDHEFEPGPRGYGALCKKCGLARASHVGPPNEPPDLPVDHGNSDQPDDDLPFQSTFEIDLFDEQMMISPDNG